MKDKKDHTSSCCGPAPQKEPEKSCCGNSATENLSAEESGIVAAVDSEWTASDYWGQLKARSGSFRNKYSRYDN